MTVTAANPALKTYLINFVLWLGLFGILHFVFFPAYAQLMLLLGEYGLEGVTGQAITLFSRSPASGGIFGEQGFSLATSTMANPFHYPHNLYSIALNFMFAPALVMATLGANRPAALRAVLAAGLILLLHAVHIITIALYFPLTQAPIPNPIIDRDFAQSLFAPLVRWNYAFTDKMGYTLFPFIAWLTVCFTAVVEMINQLAMQRSEDHQT